MKNAWLWVAPIVFGLGAALILVAGTPRGEKQIQDWLIGWPERPQGETGVITVRQRRDGSLVADFGDDTWELDMPKTDVYDGIGHVSGFIRVTNQHASAILVSAPTKRVSVNAGGIECVIEDISTAEWPPEYPPGPVEGEFELIFAVYIERMDVVKAHEFVYFKLGDPTPWDISRDYQISVTGQRLRRTETTTYGAGRDAKPVYAKEVHEADAWAETSPVSWDVSFGGLSDSGTGPDPDMPAPINQVTFSVNQHKGNAGVEYARISLAWNTVDVSFAQHWKDHGSWKFEGVGNEVYAEVTNTGAIDQQKAFTHLRPKIVDFSQFVVLDRLGAQVDDLRVDGPLQASPYVPSSLGWSTDP